VFYAAVMVAFPSVTEAGSKTAISIWLNSVVPVLLPFFIFADFIRRTADPERIPARVYPFIAAFLSGYPMGAKVTGDMVKEGAVSPERGKHILSYSLVTGPAFILGTVGAFFGSSQAAAIVALAHYLGAFCNGLFWRVGGSKNDNLWLADTHGKRKNNNYLDDFTDSILAGFRAMALVLAYIMRFMIGTQLLDSLGLFSLMPGAEWEAFAKGIFEMTIGTNAVGMCNIPLGLKVVMAAFIVSFGGLSVIGQSLSVSGGGWINLIQIVKIKLTHGLIAGIIAAVMVMVTDL